MLVPAPPIPQSLGKDFVWNYTNLPMSSTVKSRVFPRLFRWELDLKERTYESLLAEPVELWLPDYTLNAYRPLVPRRIYVAANL